MDDASPPELSVVMPAYNEAELIEGSLSAVCDFVRQRGLTAEIIVVDDGSSDDTAALVERALAPCSIPWRLLRQKPNAGKALAVRRGMLDARGRYLLMTDADLSTPMEEYDKLRSALNAGADIAIASRALPGSKREPPQPWLREMLGRAFAFVRGVFVLRRIADTQCGFKLFTHEAGREAFGRQTMSSWAFDAEVLYIADRLGYHIAELPVIWRNRKESKVRVLRDLWKVMRDLAIVRWRHARLRREDRAEVREVQKG